MTPHFPHSADSVLVAAHQKMLEDLSAGQAKILEKLEQLPVILSEVKRTNGRVTELEKESARRLQRLATLETEQDQTSSVEEKLMKAIDEKAKSVDVDKAIRQAALVGAFAITLLVGYLGGLSMVVVGHLQQDVIRVPSDITEHLPHLK